MQPLFIVLDVVMVSFGSLFDLGSAIATTVGGRRSKGEIEVSLVRYLFGFAKRILAQEHWANESLSRFLNRK